MLISVRDERILHDYFDYYIHRHRVRLGQANVKRASPAAPDVRADPIFRRIALSPRRLLRKAAASNVDSAVLPTPTRDSIDIKPPANGEEQNQIDEDNSESEVDEVILVRKLGSVASLRARRLDVLRQLEVVNRSRLSQPMQLTCRHTSNWPSVS